MNDVRPALWAEQERLAGIRFREFHTELLQEILRKIQGHEEMNRFGLGERHAPQPLVDNHDDRRHPLLTLAYLHWWDKGQRVPADVAARLIETAKP